VMARAQSAGGQGSGAAAAAALRSGGAALQVCVMVMSPGSFMTKNSIRCVAVVGVDVVDLAWIGWLQYMM
jgi:hypothetical protein